MGPAVGYAGQRVGGIVGHLGHELGVGAPVWAEELHIEIAHDGKVQHDLDGVLVFGLANLSERAPDVLLQVGLTVDALHHQLVGGAAQTGLDDLEAAVGLSRFFQDRGAQHRVDHLEELLLFGAGGDLPPGGAGVVEVPVLQGEGEADPQGGGLTEDGQALVAYPVQPTQGTTMDLGVLAGGGDGIVENGPTRHLG